MTRLEEVLGKRTVIMGEAGTGKTVALLRIVERLRNAGLSELISIIDMAPVRIRGYGGVMKDYASWVTDMRYLAPPLIYPPRILGRTAEDVLRYAALNARRIRPLLLSYIEDPTPILVVNDATIYIHAGDEALLYECVENSETFVASIYYGNRLNEDRGSGISMREREFAERLSKYVDNVINLAGSSGGGG